ncbi:uncharacterized protein LOC116247406 isoform X1 [Nymphaea colorata]|nr:uncharacterized protein LOC116247406 isoform X1 [Nymphaea colorata]
MDDLPEGDFPDWEILPSHDRCIASPPHEPQDHQNSGFVEDDSHGIIKPLYFSSDPAVNFLGVQEASEGDTSGADPEPDDPMWVDPCLESCLRERVVEMDESEEEKPEKSSESGDSLPENHVFEPERMEVEAVAGCNEESKEVGSGLEPGGLEEKEFRVVGRESKVRSWWRVSFELMKVFVLRSSPFWSLSVGVVAMGVLILGRRWYKAKRKAQSSIKVCVEDKQKVSQFMVQAARLNEAFSVVRRVPAIRSSLLPSGVSPWPVIGLR